MGEANIITKLRKQAAGNTTRRRLAEAEAILRNPGRVVMLRCGELAEELGVSARPLTPHERDALLRECRRWLRGQLRRTLCFR